ncbi:MAG TPA: class II aldolase/adducin family protein [Candidatus Hydrogenedentes bacterium]|nr:class II aldolase/adducin family protein [Candidatus Hydrogenedentota bacterium]HQM49833.1 class II aldolase/adducin family protein [Candidatus Hydrogenedentota bacterium]
MENERALREAICNVGRRLWEKGFVAATDGNISVRLSDERFLCTPSGVSKGFMAPNDLIVADASGNKVSGQGGVTSEFRTHLAAYEEREDIRAVVHAHPPKAIAASLAGLSLAEPVLPELLLTLGGIPTAEYATPATGEGGEAIRKLIRICDAVLIEKHGSLTVGRDVLDAYHKLEKIEHAAEILLWANLLGRPEPLSSSEITALHRIQSVYAPGTRLFKPE